MAARRILSLLAAKVPQSYLPMELSRSFHPCTNSFSRSYEQYTRKFSSLAESSIPTVENPVDYESANSNPDPGSDQLTSNLKTDQTAAEHRVNSSLKVSERHDLAMMFTCKVCDTRSIKTACRESYEKGVVVVRCDGCNNLHLIADRLGWFGEPGSVEEFLAARGEEVKKGSVDTLNLTLEDLTGKKNLDI